MGDNVDQLSLETVQNAAKMLRCISHPVRIRIIELLDRDGERNVTEIYETLELEQAVASQHLSLMNDKGVLSRRRDGVHVYYGIADLRVIKVLNCLRTPLGEER